MNQQICRRGLAACVAGYRHKYCPTGSANSEIFPWRDRSAPARRAAGPIRCTRRCRRRRRWRKDATSGRSAIATLCIWPVFGSKRPRRPRLELTYQIMPSPAISRRRTVVPSGRSNSRIASVSGSTFSKTIAAVAGDPQRAICRQLDAIGTGVFPGHRDQLDLAGGRNQAADHVAHLQCEIHPALLVEHGRMRIFGVGIGHLVFGDLAGFRIELADCAVAVAGVPDIAVTVRRDAVRQRFIWQRVFPHFAGFRIDPADEIAELPAIPNRAVRRLHRIARPLAQLRHFPFA